MSLLVQDFLRASAERFPQKTALVCDGVRLTYGQIESVTNQLANALLDHGLVRGARVVIHLGNSIDTVLSIFGVLKAGGVFVVLNPSTKPDKLLYIVNNCEASVLITSSGNRALATEMKSSAPSLSLTVLSSAKESGSGDDPDLPFLGELLSRYPVSRPSALCIDKDLACLVYTSGSTGDPKGVVSGHDNVVFASRAIITYLENTSSDIVLSALPLSFDYGLYQLLMSFRFGGTLVLERSFAYPAQVLGRIAEERVTGFPVVPTIVALVLRMDLGKFDLTSLRYVTNTAAALPAEHIMTLHRALPGTALYSMYGLTECKRTLYLPPVQLEKRPESVGIAIPGTEVWLQDDAGNRLGPGATGELVVRGSHVMRGYWGDPETTARTYRPGPTPGERVLHTGDIFRMDEEGYLYFLSRKDDIIKSRGEKVAPKEVERVLYGIEGVQEAVVVGVPDPVLGQAITAFVVVGQDGPDVRELKRACAENLESFMVPKTIVLRDNLPKTANGKVDRQRLSQEDQGANNA